MGNYNTKTIILVLIFTGIVLLQTTLYSQDHQKLEYDVAVSARIVPVFATDNQGNPVFDLKAHEILFYVNGKPVSFMLERYSFDFENEECNRKKLGQEHQCHKDKPVPYTGNRRAIFLVIDSIFNSQTGLKRSKQIASNIIYDKLPGDDFIILENHPGNGLRYIAGPDNNKEDLINALEKVSAIPEKFDRSLLTAAKVSEIGSIDASVQNNRLRFKKLNGALHRYRSKIKKLSASVSRIKFALKTINRPKMVYLISEGVKKFAFQENYTTDSNSGSQQICGSHIQGYLYRYLQNLSRAINEGGSVLYTINPAKIEFENVRSDNVISDESLNYLAKESGGKYFCGSDLDIIANEVRKTTSAYYELAFPLTASMGNVQSFKIKSTRPGVKIHTVQRMVSERPYTRMEQPEKKLFALNVAHQGTWSRMVAKTEEVSFQTIKKEQNGKNDILSIKVDMPDSLWNKKVDIYLIRTGKKSDSIDFGINHKRAGKVETLTFETKKDRKHYFVIIEPGKPYCIYNHIKP